MTLRRKSESPNGDDRPKKRRAPQGKDSCSNSNGRLWACPYYIFDQTQYLHCLYRNQLTSPSFVRQHIRRYHRRCPDCGIELNTLDLDCDSSSSSFRKNPECPAGCELRYQRGISAKERWYKTYDTLFPARPLPRQPFIVSPEDEIVRMTLDAIRWMSPQHSNSNHHTPHLDLDNLNSWSAVSSILESVASSDRELDKTPSEAGTISTYGPPTPPELESAFPDFASFDTDPSLLLPVASMPSAPAAALSSTGQQGLDTTDYDANLEGVPRLDPFDKSMAEDLDQFAAFGGEEGCLLSDMDWNGGYCYCSTSDCQCVFQAQV